MTEPLIEPWAPLLTWMPFWAISGVSPAPVTVVREIFALEPAPSTVMPFFWYWLISSDVRVAFPTSTGEVHAIPTWIPTPPWQPLIGLAPAPRRYTFLA